MSHARRLVALSASLALTCALAACGSGGADDAEAPAAGGEASLDGLFDQAAADLLPEDVASEGVIHVASGPGYPPILDVAADGTTLTGSEPEQMRLVGAVLGVEIVFDDIKFDAVFPALESGKTDVAALALGVTAERLATVDFVSDFEGGTTLLVAEGNPEDISIDTVCGHTVGVLKGSTEEVNDIPRFQDACSSAGQPAVEVSTFTTAADAVLALGSGRVEATVTSLPAAVFQAEESGGALEALDESFSPVPWGLALPKGSELAPALAAALNVLVEDGRYQENLDAFDVGAGAIDEAVVYTSPDQLTAP